MPRPVTVAAVKHGRSEPHASYQKQNIKDSEPHLDPEPHLVQGLAAEQLCRRTFEYPVTSRSLPFTMHHSM